MKHHTTISSGDIRHQKGSCASGKCQKSENLYFLWSRVIGSESVAAVGCEGAMCASVRSRFVLRVYGSLTIKLFLLG
jgi:hypothetical protein